MLPIDNEIVLHLRTTEYKAALLLGLVRDQARQARRAQQFVVEAMPAVAVPDRLGVWLELVQELEASLAEAKIGPSTGPSTGSGRGPK
jgi:hypothetical protein